MNLDGLKAAFSYAKGVGGNFVSSNRSWLVYVVGAIVLFGGGYAVGRYVVPGTTVVTDKIQVVEKQVIVTQTKTDVKIVKVHDSETDKKIHRITTEKQLADGSKEKTTTEDINTETIIHDNTNTVEVRYVDRIVEKEKDIKEEKTKTTSNEKPQWRIGADVGLSVPYFIGQGEVGTPGMHGAVVGVDLNRRVIGPFFMGVRANTQGVVGLALSGEF